MDPVAEQEQILYEEFKDALERLPYRAHYFEQAPFIWAEILIPDDFFREGGENEGWYKLLHLVVGRLDWNTPFFIEARYIYLSKGLKGIEKYISTLYREAGGRLDLKKVLPILENIREFLRRYPFLHEYINAYRQYFTPDFRKPFKHNYPLDYQRQGVESYAAYLRLNLQAQWRKKWDGLHEIGAML